MHFHSEELVPRIHDHSGCIAPNALVLGNIRSIITFVMEYPEAHCYLGGFLGARGMTFNCFHQLPQNALFGSCIRTAQLPRLPKLCPNQHSAKCGETFWVTYIVVSRPLTDLCAVCQKVLQFCSLLTSARIKIIGEDIIIHSND